jgi:hypothetical protein
MRQDFKLVRKKQPVKPAGAADTHAHAHGGAGAGANAHSPDVADEIDESIKEKAEEDGVDVTDHAHAHAHSAAGKVAAAVAGAGREGRIGRSERRGGARR